MKMTILTQKNVCALLGLLMALTILWSAKAEANVDRVNEVIPTELKEVFESNDEVQLTIDVDLSEIKDLPTITIINKYGEVVAEFYGNKTELMDRFPNISEKGKFVTASGKHEYYLL